MQIALFSFLVSVNCRIGSLEKCLDPEDGQEAVNCRIGSLETIYPVRFLSVYVNCRIGSLEKESTA